MDIYLNVSSAGTTDIIKYIISNNYPLLNAQQFIDKGGKVLVVSTYDKNSLALRLIKDDPDKWHLISYSEPHKARRHFNGFAWICDVDDHYYFITI